jgi:hypothetical protein
MLKRAIAAVALIGLLAVAPKPAAAIEQQRATNWCWAAVINDAYSVTGSYRSQTQIAADLDGWPRDRPAYIAEVVALLRAYGFTAWETGRPASYQELYTTLGSGAWIIAFVRPSSAPVGHFIDIKGFDPNSGYLWAGDPATGTEGWIAPERLYAIWQDAIVVTR